MLGFLIMVLGARVPLLLGSFNCLLRFLEELVHHVVTLLVRQDHSELLLDGGLNLLDGVLGESLNLLSGLGVHDNELIADG